MNWRRLGIIVAINIAVSVVTTLVVLSIWDAHRPAAALIPTLIAQPQAIPSLESTALPEATALPVPTDTRAPSPSPTPSGPFAYVIQDGDTLGGLSLAFDVPLADLLAANNLAEDAILSVGQTITIPVGGSPTVAPPPIGATPAATTGPAFVIIREIESPGALDAETIVLTNVGQVVNLTGWTLSDGAGNRYTFPDVTIFADAEINLHTRAGPNTPSDLYWGQSATRWGKTGTVAYLRDARGKLVATYQVP